MSEVKVNPFEVTIAVVLNKHKFGLNRKVKEGEAKAVQMDGEPVSREAVALTKRLLASEEYDAIGSLDSAIDSRIRKLSVPSLLRKAAVLVPFELFDKVQGELETYQREREQAVRAFVRQYDQAVENARVTLNSLFDSSQYPPADAVKSRFWVDVNYVDFGVSNSLKRVNEGLWKKEKERLEVTMRNAAEEIRATMRAGLADLVSHLAERLSGQDDSGRPRIFRDSAVNNLTEWLEFFSARNITSDTELDALVKKCQGMLSGVDPDTLRKSVDVRAETARALGKIKSSLDTMLTSAPSRKFSFDDEA